MKLQEALLCVDCEALYSLASHCPECGSQVAYPLGRALNREAASSSSASPSRKSRLGRGLRPGVQQAAGALSAS
jgi:hypothetical protein